MDWLGQLDATKFLLFTLVLTRVSGLSMTAPVFGTNDVPMHVRALLAMALALLMTPSQWNVEVQWPGTTVNYLVVIGSELVVGLSLGLGVTILFNAMEMAGQIIAQVSGLAIAEVFDPTQDSNVSVFSRMLSLLTLAIFLCIGGHRLLLGGLLDTFQNIPPGSVALPASLTEMIVTLVTESFSLGLRASAPLVVSLLLANLVLGIISRTLPQLNVLAVGLGINAMLTFGALTFTIGAAAWVFQRELEPALETIFQVFRPS